MIRSVSLCLFLLSSISLLSQENRTIDGTGNNPTNLNWGATHAPLLRVSTVNYSDGMQQMNDADLPSPRVISNQLFDQNDNFYESQDHSDYTWLWGQFLDHDISLTEGDPRKVSFLEIPEDDLFFDQSTIVPLSRSISIPGTGTDQSNPLQYSNEVTSFIDGSMVYGSDQERANWLRSFEDGKLRVSKDISGQKDLLPWNTTNYTSTGPVDGSAPFMADDTRQLTRYFVAGDIRANENHLLIAMHTLFVREHNRLCDELKGENPSWEDEKLYQEARRKVGAIIQAITYYEWLPSLGIDLPPYQGYIPTTDPSIFNVFSAAAFRIGHTMIDSDIVLMDDDGQMTHMMDLSDVFFKPDNLLTAGGIEPFLKGMGTQVMQEMDCKIVSDLRNFLFKESNGIGLDLASINIFRGRDRGLSNYNKIRQDFGMSPITDFSQITDSQEDVRIMEELYGNVNNIDPWVGMLSEKHVTEDAMFGELVMRILKEQFRRLRNGDRFYFENDIAFSPAELQELKSTSLHDVVMRNTAISLMQKELFTAMPHIDIPGQIVQPEELQTLVFPNPVTDQTVVKIHSEEEQIAEYKLMDAMGRLLSSGSIELSEGNENYIDFNFGSEYDKGLYTLLIETSTAYSITKLIK